jgi:membrane protein YdbS with pleckstrin-like domain
MIHRDTPRAAGRASAGRMTAMTAVPVREPAWSMPRSAISLWATQGVIGSVVLGLAVAAFLVFAPSSLGEPVPLLRWLLPAAAAVYAVVAIGVRPWLRHRVYRWEITADAAFTRTGWLTQTWTLVPISRIQTVDVTRGVLQQVFGLATVAVLTASSEGTVRIDHLEHDVAQRVAADLAARAEAVRDEAT